MKINQSNQFITLRDKIQAIQRVKTSLGIESLAASDLHGFWDGDRREAAEEMGNKNPPSWKDFEELERRLWDETSHNALGWVTWAMVEIVKKIDPAQIITKDYTHSWLMYIATVDPTAKEQVGFINVFLWATIEGGGRPPWSKKSRNISLGNEVAIINSACTLRIILEKVGSSLSDEAEIIQKLLNAPVKEVREEGARAAVNTYKHEWRRSIQDTGLIPALKKEQNDSIRADIAIAIALADPKAILEEHDIGQSEKFYPLRLLLTDPSSTVKAALTNGIGMLLQAQMEGGRYYETFREVPHVSARQKVEATNYVVRIIEDLLAKDSLSSHQRVLLFNTIYIVSELSLHTEQNDALKRLAAIDPVNLVKVTTREKFTCSETNRETYISEVATGTLSSILAQQIATKPNYLNYCFLTHSKVDELKRNTRETKIVDNFHDALASIERSAINYVSKTESEKIQWGNHSEFNASFNFLLDILQNPQRDEQSRLAILNLIHALYKNGVRLSEKEKIALLDADALSAENKEKLLQTLSCTIHSGQVTGELFLNPNPDVVQGKALLLYRDLTISYKDYFGMNDLEQKCLEAAVVVITTQRTPKGLLFSGIPGTGKSIFGGVLANEVALPLRAIKSSEVTSGTNGELLIKENENHYTMEEYLADIKKTGCCVVLIDEINIVAIPSTSTSRVTPLLEGLQRLPVIIIGTTNAPTLDKIEGMVINDAGTSEEIDKVLAQRVHPECFKVMEPCYLFHRSSVGTNFSYEYLGHLLKVKGLQKPLDIELVSILGKGLTPFDIKVVIDKVFSRNNDLTLEDDLIGEVGKLQLGRSKILDRAGFIKTSLRNLEREEALKVVPPVNYKVAAFLVEDVPYDRIEQILKKAPSLVDQASLLSLLQEHINPSAKIVKLIEKLK